MRTSSTSTLAPGWWPHLAMRGWSGCQMADTNCRALRPPTAQPPANGVPCSPPKSCSPSPGASGRSPALFERAGGAEPVGLPACAAPRPRLPKNILKIFGPWTADVQGPRLNSCVMNVILTTLNDRPVTNRALNHRPPRPAAQSSSFQYFPVLFCPPGPGHLQKTTPVPKKQRKSLPIYNLTN